MLISISIGDSRCLSSSPTGYRENSCLGSCQMLESSFVPGYRFSVLSRLFPGSSQYAVRHMVSKTRCMCPHSENGKQS